MKLSLPKIKRAIHALEIELEEYTVRWWKGAPTDRKLIDEIDSTIVYFRRIEKKLEKGILK